MGRCFIDWATAVVGEGDTCHLSVSFIYQSSGPIYGIPRYFLPLYFLPFSLGLDVPLGRCLLELFPLLVAPVRFHSSTFSMELIESSETSITDCWYSVPLPPPPPLPTPPSPLPPPGVSALIIMAAWPPGVGVEEGRGVGPPRVP